MAKKMETTTYNEIGKEFEKGWKHFCSCINFGNSALDATAVSFMNTMPAKVIKALKILGEKPSMVRPEQLQQFVEDAAAFIRWSFINGKSNAFILEHLAYDICSLERNAKCFVPRVSGYALKEQEVS